MSLAILPFRNASGDSSIDWLGPSLAEMLGRISDDRRHCERSPTDRLHQILRDLRISADSIFDPATLRTLAKFSNADTVFWGQYLKFGNEIRIDATLEDLKRQRSIPLKAQAPSQSGLQAAIDQLAQSIRDGLSLSSTRSRSSRRRRSSRPRNRSRRCALTTKGCSSAARVSSPRL